MYQISIVNNIKKVPLFDYSLEEIKSLYIDDSLKFRKEKIYRVDTSIGRQYGIVKGKKIFIYPSVTTIIHKYHPMDINLLKWYAEKGWDESHALLKELANYGTFIHILFCDLVLGKNIDLVELENRIKEFIEQKNVDPSTINIKDWKNKAKQDCIGFIRFINDYRINPVSVEIGLASHKGGYAGTIDLVAYGFWDGKNNELAIIDFKSGRNDFYSDYSIQLEAYRNMWNENYPDKKIYKIFNYGCKKYNFPIGKSVTPYRFENQSKNSCNYKWKIYLSMLRKDGIGGIKKEVLIGDGTINRNTNVNEIFIEFDPLSFIKENLTKSSRINRSQLKLAI